MCNVETEGFASTEDASNEAVQNVAAVYNDQNMTVSNITVNDINVTNASTFKGGSNNSQGSTHLPYSDGNNYISADNNYIRGNVYVTNGDKGLTFTNGWTGYPDSSKTQSEISNDTKNYKSLMVVGNRSAGSNRKVGIWDDLRVAGTLTAGATGINGHRWLPHVQRNGTGWTNYECGANEIMCGIGFHHNAHEQWWEERTRIKCCKVG